MMQSAWNFFWQIRASQITEWKIFFKALGLHMICTCNALCIWSIYKYKMHRFEIDWFRCRNNYIFLIILFSRLFFYFYFCNINIVYFEYSLVLYVYNFIFNIDVVPAIYYIYINIFFGWIHEFVPKTKEKKKNEYQTSACYSIFTVAIDLIVHHIGDILLPNGKLQYNSPDDDELVFASKHSRH